MNSFENKAITLVLLVKMFFFAPWAELLEAWLVLTIG